jgi:hypothetical protein
MIPLSHTPIQPRRLDLAQVHEPERRTEPRPYLLASLPNSAGIPCAATDPG